MPSTQLSRHSIGVYAKPDMPNALVGQPGETKQTSDDTAAQQSTNINGNDIDRGTVGAENDGEDGDERNKRGDCLANVVGGDRRDREVPGL